MDPDQLIRLTIALVSVGTLLLALEIFLPGRAFASLGLLSSLVGAGLAGWGHSIDLAAMIFLGVTTVASLGLVVVLTCFPQSPLARHWMAKQKPDFEPIPEDE